MVLGEFPLDNPPVNAIGVALRAAIHEALSELLLEKHINAIVLYGTGRFFSAGADIKEFARTAEQPTLPRHLLGRQFVAR